MGRALFVAASVTDDASLPTLNRAPHDARAVCKVFEEALDSGEAVETRVVIDPTVSEFREALGWLAVGEGLSVLYFSGHGLRRSGRVALAAADSHPSRSETYLGSEELANRLRYSDCAQLLVLLDCCFAEAVAVEIAGRVRDGGPSVFAIAAADVLTLAHATSPAAKKASGALPELSPFTAALVVGLQGVASVGEGEVDLGDVFELISAESVRLGFPAPALLRSGTAREPRLRFRLPEDPRTFDLNRSAYTVETSHPLPIGGFPTWVVGSDGRRSLAVAGHLANGRDSAVLDAHNGLTTDLSLFRLRGQRAGDTRLYVGATSETRSLVREAAASGPVVAITAELPPNNVGGPIVRVPPVAESEIIISAGIESREELFAFQHNAEAIVEFAGDSIERAVAATRAVLANRDGPPGPLLHRLESHFRAVTAPSDRMLIYSLLAFASGSYLPTRAVIGFVASRTGLPESQVSAGVIGLVQAGVAQKSGRWLRTIAPLHFWTPPSAGVLFADFVDHAWRNPRTDVRLQLMLAMASLLSRLVRSQAVDDDSLRLLADYGRDLLDCAGPANMLPLIDAVIGVRNGDVPSDIYVHKGDALRLSDDYAGAAEAFSVARARSVSRLGQIRAEVGLMSARKNDYTEEALLRELSKEGPHKAATESKSSVAVLARALHEYGNVQMAISDWPAALEAYESADRLLDVSDLSHSAVLLDLWKGAADVHLHRGDVLRASSLLSDALDLAAASGSVFLDGRAHAKLLQFAGDVTRHSAFDQDHTVRAIEVAEWWYSRSASIYKRNGLRLGWLISRFRIHQCQLVEGRLRDSQFGFADVWREFAAIPNPLWEYKSAVFVCLSSALTQGLALPALSEAVRHIESRLTRDALSRYQQQWGKLALAAVQGRPIALFAERFEEIGANSLAFAVSEGLSGRLGCFY